MPIVAFHSHCHWEVEPPAMAFDPGEKLLKAFLVVRNHKLL